VTLVGPELAPFTAALFLMLLLVAAEVIGAVVGVLPSAALDSALPDFAEPEFGAGGALDADAPGLGDSAVSRVLGWLSVGKVPVLVLLIAFLASFGLAGLLLQNAAESLAGARLHAALAAIPAFAGGLVLTRWTGRGVAALLPKDQSQASSAESFVGRVATVTAGLARKNLPAGAELTGPLRQSP
jgi:hypothetical protein